MTITTDRATPTAAAPVAAGSLAQLSREGAERLYAELAQMLGKQSAAGPAGPVPVVSAAAGTGAGEAVVDVAASELAGRVRPAGPVVAIMGELKVVGAAGVAPVAKSTGAVSVPQMQRCAAFAGFLALHPGASFEAVHAAFWPGVYPEGATASASRNKLAGQTRRYLGQAVDGAPFFPLVRSSGYRLHEAVTTDWQVFCQVVGEDPARASTAALVAGLRLVRGAPFEHARAKNVAWTEELHRQMVARIGAAAHELWVRAMAAGHHGHAQLAARVGRTVDPGNEAAWREAMTAEAAADAREEVARLVERLYAYLDAVEAEPEAETAQLIARLAAQGYRVGPDW